MMREGTLTIGLNRHDDALRAAIASTRAPLPPSLLQGKSPAAVAELLPRVFAICALAQGSAAVAACEAAQGRSPDPAEAARREFLTSAEAVREHLLRLVLGAAEALGEKPTQADFDLLRNATGSLRQAALDSDPASWRTASGNVSAALAALIGAHLHVPADTDAPAAFLDWVEAARSPFARLCRRILSRDEARIGAQADEHASDALDIGSIGPLLLGPDGAEFALRPSLDRPGQETTAYARRRGEPLIAGLSSSFGDGLLTRLAARQVDAIRLAESLPRLAAVAGTTSRSGPASPGRGDGDGSAAVETARGRLIHAVRLRGGKVETYRVLAPTEWNFHPIGPVARRLARLAPRTSPEDLQRQARLLIDIFDPCIPYSVSVQ